MRLCALPSTSCPTGARDIIAPVSRAYKQKRGLSQRWLPVISQPRREEAVQGKGEASLSRPTSILDRTRRCTPRGRSQGGPACPERSGKTGHQRTASGWGDDGRVECWNVGMLGKAAGPPTHRSNIPLFHYSYPPVPFRWCPVWSSFRARTASSAPQRQEELKEELKGSGTFFGSVTPRISGEN